MPSGIELNKLRVINPRRIKSHGVLYAGGNDKVLGLAVQQDEPHALYIVAGIAPVAKGVHIAQVQAVLQASFLYSILNLLKAFAVPIK